jgi:predicted nucleic acid-binding protein
MILVDTSIWIEHLRRGDERLARILEQGQVLSHPYVIGELALGSLRNRERILGALQDLPQTSVATGQP